PTANSLLRAVENVTITVGTLLGGVVAAASGPHLAYWLNAASFLISAALIVRIPARLLQSEAPLSRGHLSDLADGFRLVRSSRALITVVVAWNLLMVANGLINVSEIALAKI